MGLTFLQIYKINLYNFNNKRIFDYNNNAGKKYIYRGKK